MKINRNFDNLVPNYLFADVAKKTNAYIAAHPDKKVIKLGIGDVTLPNGYRRRYSAYRKVRC